MSPESFPMLAKSAANFFHWSSLLSEIHSKRENNTISRIYFSLTYFCRRPDDNAYVVVWAISGRDRKVEWGTHGERARSEGGNFETNFLREGRALKWGWLCLGFTHNILFLISGSEETRTAGGRTKFVSISHVATVGGLLDLLRSACWNLYGGEFDRINGMNIYCWFLLTSSDRFLELMLLLLDAVDFEWFDDWKFMKSSTFGWFFFSSDNEQWVLTMWWLSLFCSLVEDCWAGLLWWCAFCLCLWWCCCCCCCWWWWWDGLFWLK